MSRLNLFATICAALCFTSAESNSVSGVDLSALLRLPPYYSALGYHRPASLSDSDYQQLVQISEKYNMKISDLYQLYDLAAYNLPSCSPNVYIDMIQQFAEAVEIERMRRGLPCNRYSLRSGISSPLIDSVLNTPYVPLLQRRNVGETLDNLYDHGSAVAGDLCDMGSELYHQGKAAASSLYKNLYNMADYAISKPTQALKNQISDIIYGNVPQTEMSKAENFAGQINESLKYMISN